MIAEVPVIPPVDPNEWATAILRVGWPVFALAALWITLRWWPWRRTKE